MWRFRCWSRRGFWPSWQLQQRQRSVLLLLEKETESCRTCTRYRKNNCPARAPCGTCDAVKIIVPHVQHAFSFIIRFIFSFLFIGREPTTRPANNCLQISVLLQIIFCSCVLEITLLCENGRSVARAVRECFDIFSWSKEQWSNDKTIIELGYRKISWFVSVSLINISCHSLWLRQIIDLLANDKSRCFAQPCSMIVKYLLIAPRLKQFVFHSFSPSHSSCASSIPPPQWQRT